MSTIRPTSVAAPPPETREYRVEYMVNDRLVTKDIRACYMQQEGMTVFKDHSHATVFAVNPHMLISVERLPLPGGIPAIRPGIRPA